MKFFSKLIGQLPLAGKLMIRPMLFSVYLSTNKTQRNLNYAFALVLLLFLVWAHSYQAVSGIEALFISPPLWAKSISALYASVNIGVTIVQAYLCFKLTHFVFRARLTRTRKFIPDYTLIEVLTMLTVTLGGQIVFALTAQHFNVP